MIKKNISVLQKILIVMLLFSCSNSTKESVSNRDSGQNSSVIVFAAASLRDVLDEIVGLFESKYNMAVKLNLASSGTLARQIEWGGEFDVYLSASKRWAVYIDSLGYFKAGPAEEVVHNRLVMIAPKDSPLDTFVIRQGLDIRSMLGEGRLSMGDPAHVPAGFYGRQALEWLHGECEKDVKILPAKDVRSALMMVELGEVPLGIVYLTDVMKSDKVKVLGVFPEVSHQPVVYMGGVAGGKKDAGLFWTFILSPEARPVWEKYGFSVD